MFIDTHAHLDFPEYKTEIPAILGRAKEVGVGRIINVGVDLETSKHSVDLARKYPEIYAAIGIHPESANGLDIETQNRLFSFIANKKVIAIGEIGLDYYYLKRSSKYSSYATREQQLFCFEQMLDLALETKLPAIIHSREADTDMYGILKSYHGQLRAVIHCFSSDWDFAEKILDLGFVISVTGNITYKNPSLVEALHKIPLSSLMVETDSPFLAPEIFRGKRNEPAHVVEVAKKLAEIKGVPLREVEAQTTENALKFFAIS